MKSGLEHPQFLYLHDANPSIIEVPRYATPYNFTGKPMRGYNKQAVVISQALINPLNNVQAKLNAAGYDLVVYDSYRPHKAVEFYLQFIEDEKDMNPKELYFPNIQKKIQLVELDYVSRMCPHSRGCAIDVSIIKKGKRIIPPAEMKVKIIQLENSDKTTPYLDDGTQFMGTHFDFFDDSSHWGTNLVNAQAKMNRDLLLAVMEEFGFEAYQKEWWHFSLIKQAYPEACFDFDII